MENSEKLEISKEILQYAKETENYSYYDLLTIAYNEKNEWIPVLTDKKMRGMFSTCLKSAKYSTHTKYQSSAADAMERCWKARFAYEKRQGLLESKSSEE